MPPKDRSEVEDVELEWKRLQIEELREKLANRRAEIARLENLRAKQLVDFERGQLELKRRQSICKHRKGGRDNKFANGNDNNFAVVRNTYPNGETIIMCTRCFDEARKPDPRMRKANPDLYKQQLDKWRIWDQMPTDNSPSGGKIFEIIPASAA